MRHFRVLPVIVRSIRFGPDGRSLCLISGPIEGDEKGLELLEHAFRIDTRLGSSSHRPFSGSEVAIFTPDMRWLYHSVSVAVGGGELDIYRLELLTGKEEHVYSSIVPYPHSLAFTPNGHILAIGGINYWGGDGRGLLHRLDVWHVTELHPIETDAMCLAYSPDGSRLAAGSRAGFGRSAGVRIWEGKRLTEELTGAAEVLAWSPDGQLAWGTEELIIVARPSTQEPQRVLEETGGHMTDFAFSADSRLIVTGSRNGACSLHEVATGRVVASFDWGIGAVTALAFSPDGLTCAAGGEKGQVVVWDVDA